MQCRGNDAPHDDCVSLPLLLQIHRASVECALHVLHTCIKTSSTNRAREAFGVCVDELGVKDVVLPGEVKALLNRVIEAEKAAAAHVIPRREGDSGQAFARRHGKPAVLAAGSAAGPSRKLNRVWYE